jgi:hypothetical protein
VTHSIGWWTLAFWSFGSLFWAEVPACRRCRGRMIRRRWIGVAVDLVVAAIGVSIGLAIFRAYAKLAQKWLILPVALACYLPVWLWETFVPKPIALTAYADTVDYEFRDADYAREFAELNGASPEDEA